MRSTLQTRRLTNRCPFIRRTLLLLAAFSILASTAAAQSEQEKRSAAEKLVAEAKQTAGAGTVEAYNQAIKKFEQALAIYKEIGDSKFEAKTLTNIGIIYMWANERQSALDYLSRALPLARAAQDARTEGLVLSMTGEIYYSLGDMRKAISYQEQALPKVREAGDRNLEAAVMNDIANAQDILGDKQKALDAYLLAQAIARETGNRDGEATTLNNIGMVYHSMGESQKALDYYMKALGIRQEIKDKNGEAAALNNIGNLYNILGDNQKALEYLKQALSLMKALGDRSGVATALGNVANIFQDLGRNQEALDYYLQALDMKREIGDRVSEATTLNNIGQLYGNLGQYPEALKYYGQAVEVAHAVGDTRTEAATLTNMGAVYSWTGDKQKALSYYVQALPLRRAVRDSDGEATTLFNMAVVKRDLGNLDESRQNIETAIELVESLRTRISNRELRTSYFATVQNYYSFYIDLLMRLHKQRPGAGNDARALQTSERARARALLETLAESNADIRQGVDPMLVERERELKKQLNAKAQEQIKLLTSAHTDAQAGAIGSEIDRLTTQLQQVETQIRQTSPRYAALTQPQPLSLKEIQAGVLDDDTLLLEYSLGLPHSYLWVVSTTSITSYELPRREEIEESARRVYELLNARNRRVEGETVEQRRARISRADAQYAAASAELSRKILAPVAKQLANKRLLVVADGVLNYIPFAALPDPSDIRAPLVVKHEIVNLPSASTLAVLRAEVRDRRPAARTVAVLADPVFDEDDERVKVDGNNAKPVSQPRRRTRRRRDLPLGMEQSLTESGMRDAGLEIPRLPGTRQEALKILSLVPQSESKQAFDFAASRANATSGELSQYRFIHFATHGFLNSLHPELSGIVLSMVDEQGRGQDGFLRATDIFNLKLPAELVVLSACQTGLGKEIKGEGLVGLTRGFMYAGSPRVVVSLWSVSDAGTAELMTRFYQAMLKDGMRSAAALRAAQVSLLKEKRWEQPFYWAAFTLQGEWR
ncbi:MAG TPA: CHAT domain-containing tetratricopeptide repeat protein [Pyrinomonadaceae bacterium]|jgi:CHAT domain-containing protein/tetratricopeptide (TPR) repeat protein